MSDQRDVEICRLQEEARCLHAENARLRAVLRAIFITTFHRDNIAAEYAHEMARRELEGREMSDQEALADARKDRGP